MLFCEPFLLHSILKLNPCRDRQVCEPNQKPHDGVLCPKVGYDPLSGGVLQLSDSVTECNPLNDLSEAFGAGQMPPVLPGRHNWLVDHDQCRLAVEAAPGSGAVRPAVTRPICVLQQRSMCRRADKRHACAEDGISRGSALARVPPSLRRIPGRCASNWNRRW